MKKIKNAAKKTAAFIEKNKVELAYAAGVIVGITALSATETHKTNRKWNRAEDRFDLAEGEHLLVDRKGNFVAFRPIKDEN